jgi:predicted transcriptional regulator
MRPLEELHVITPDTQVLDALKLMASNDVNQLPVVANGTLQGVVTRSHLLQLLQARSELQLSATHYPPLHRMKQKGATP